jgi:acyl carrier protein
MQQKEIIEEMAKYLGVTPQDIDPQASLSEDLGLGPIELSDLLSALSEKFKITFDPAEVEGLDTVNDIIVMVEDLSLE